MTDLELMRLANQAGLEKHIVRDEENGLANRAELAKELYCADMISETECRDCQSKTFRRVRMP